MQFYIKSSIFSVLCLLLFSNPTFCSELDDKSIVESHAGLVEPLPSYETSGLKQVPFYRHRSPMGIASDLSLAVLDSEPVEEAETTKEPNYSRLIVDEKNIDYVIEFLNRLMIEKNTFFKLFSAEELFSVMNFIVCNHEDFYEELRLKAKQVSERVPVFLYEQRLALAIAFRESCISVSSSEKKASSENLSDEDSCCSAEEEFLRRRDRVANYNRGRELDDYVGYRDYIDYDQYDDPDAW